ncbi:DNA cross-link repair protein SNM1-like [Impatiens glandulifera]|uniref:DNA cross-link repair protein SNM1-like n=1 Tax=Impatiens glandulifera TaxID=253017 RepID=UPI001FB05BE6|nr:DNA cross-link repair protein SNM1-like [Impatiens glandulifera]XP_047313577.1 DNA cross-link repair protein SNM1-like [Impatiens glandulifera]
MVFKSKSIPDSRIHENFPADEDDDFQDTVCLPSSRTQKPFIPPRNLRLSQPLRSSSSSIQRPPKRRKSLTDVASGKENILQSEPILLAKEEKRCQDFESKSSARYGVSDINGDDLFSLTNDCGLDSLESSIDLTFRDPLSGCSHTSGRNSYEHSPFSPAPDTEVEDVVEKNFNLASHETFSLNVSCANGNGENEEFEANTQFDDLLKLCDEVKEEEQEEDDDEYDGGLIHCPLCRTDISDMINELQQAHINRCLDEDESKNVVLLKDDVEPQSHGQVVDGSPVQSPQGITNIKPVLDWLQNLGLERYREVFIKEEVDWDTLLQLTEQDLLSMGVAALGARKKIMYALGELRKESNNQVNASTDVADETKRLSTTKLITDFFPSSFIAKKKSCNDSCNQKKVENPKPDSRGKSVNSRNVSKKFLDIPSWCCIQGTPFRVDAFKYQRGACSHWFLTHFHLDHYQGLTRTFNRGKIYCSSITAKLVNMKIGIPWEKLEILPLNKKINIAGINVTCFDANHCPGAIIMLFEPPNNKAVLHTGDFRFCDKMETISHLQDCRIQTLVLDTTYCDPQYDFPKQEAVIQFVIEAIQAEAFNPKTLFLIGSYTIGKERLFLEVARVLHTKVHVNTAKLRILECLDLSREDMQCLTVNEQETNIHVVPMWMLASFKRLKSISNQYMKRFNLIVAFSPSGWAFGKGKKKTPGRRWQQGTIIRYEVPYSEHSSFTELKQFVKFVSPENIIPSVNNRGKESANSMVSMLLS